MSVPAADSRVIGRGILPYQQHGVDAEGKLSATNCRMMKAECRTFYIGQHSSHDGYPFDEYKHLIELKGPSLCQIGSGPHVSDIARIELYACILLGC